jgi:hypothetical protein
MSRTALRRLASHGAVISLGLVSALALVAPARLAPLAGAEPMVPRAIDAFGDGEGARLHPVHVLDGLQLRIDSLKEELRAPRPEDPEVPGSRLAIEPGLDEALPRDFDPEQTDTGSEVRP